MTNKLVIYHGGCFDGFTAAWVANQSDLWKDADFLPARYGDFAPDVHGKDVLIVDFSYPRGVLAEMALNASYLRVLDHHKTAEEDLRGLRFAHFDMERSGAGMTADFLDSRNWLVNAVEDRDLWLFSFHDTEAIMAYVAAQPMTIEAWDRLMELGQEEVARRGTFILEYMHHIEEDVAANQVVFQSIGGYVVPTVNVPYFMASNCANLLLRKFPDVPFAAAFFKRGDGKWQYSLRSDDDRKDVSEIAKKCGGGGHRNAAGFEVD